MSRLDVSELISHVEVSADSCIITMVITKSDAREHARRQMSSVVVFGLQIVAVGDESLGLAGVSFNSYKIKAPIK